MLFREINTVHFENQINYDLTFSFKFMMYVKFLSGSFHHNLLLMESCKLFFLIVMWHKVCIHFHFKIHLEKIHVGNISE